MAAKFYMCLLLVILVTSPVYCARLRLPQDAEKSPLFLFGRLFQDENLATKCCSSCDKDTCSGYTEYCPVPSYCKPECNGGKYCCCPK